MNCAGCKKPLTKVKGLMTCDTPDCPGNLHEIMTSLWKRKR